MLVIAMIYKLKRLLQLKHGRLRLLLAVHCIHVGWSITVWIDILQTMNDGQYYRDR